MICLRQHILRKILLYISQIDTKKDVPMSKWPGREERNSRRTEIKNLILGQRLYRNMRDFCLHLGVIAMLCGIAYNNLITHSNRQNQYLQQTLTPSVEVSRFLTLQLKQRRRKNHLWRLKYRILIIRFYNFLNVCPCDYTAFAVNDEVLILSTG